MAHITLSFVEHESCVCGFTPSREWTRKIGYDAMMTSAAPYNDIGRIEKGCAEVLATACDGEDVFGGVRVRQNFRKDLERDTIQARQQRRRSFFLLYLTLVQRLTL